MLKHTASESTCVCCSAETIYCAGNTLTLFQRVWLKSNSRVRSPPGYNFSIMSRPALTREQTQEVLMVALFVPLPVMAMPETPATSLTTTTPVTIDAGDVLSHESRVARVSSRVCSFLKLLSEKLRWKLDLPQMLPTLSPQRLLTRKRKHIDLFPTRSSLSVMTTQQRRRLDHQRLHQLWPGLSLLPAD